MNITWSYVNPGIIAANQLSNECGLSRAVLSEQEYLRLGVELRRQDLGSMELVIQILFLNGKELVLIQGGEFFHDSVFLLLHLLRLWCHDSGGRDQRLIKLYTGWSSVKNHLLVVVLFLLMMRGQVLLVACGTIFWLVNGFFLLFLIKITLFYRQPDLSRGKERHKKVHNKRSQGLGLSACQSSHQLITHSSSSITHKLTTQSCP